mgnify:FL=1
MVYESGEEFEARFLDAASESVGGGGRGGEAGAGALEVARGSNARPIERVFDDAVDGEHANEEEEEDGCDDDDVGVK